MEHNVYAEKGKRKELETRESETGGECAVGPRSFALKAYSYSDVPEMKSFTQRDLFPPFDNSSLLSADRDPHILDIPWVKVLGIL